MSRRLRAFGYQRGFTLLEALVTLAVLSIGLLGLLGLQTTSVASAQLSESRGAAVAATDNLGARLRANPRAARAGDYVGDYLDVPDIAEPARLCTDGVTCTPAELAAYDTWNWRGVLAARLPNGRGRIACAHYAAPSHACDRYRVTVAWHERAQSVNEPNASRSCAAQPGILAQCLQTLIRP